MRARIATGVLRARLALAERDLDRAADALDMARALIADATFPDWPARVARGEVELWLAEGKLETAAGWARRTLDDGGGAAAPEREMFLLAAARALVSKGDAASLERALRLAEPEGYVRSLSISGRRWAGCCRRRGSGM